MTYEAWRVNFQSAEQAARAAFNDARQARHELAETESFLHGERGLAREYTAEIERLQAELGKFHSASKVAMTFADTLHRDNATLRAEIGRLHAEISRMRDQKPAFWIPEKAIRNRAAEFLAGLTKANFNDRPLYLAPGARRRPLTVDEIVEINLRVATEEVLGSDSSRDVAVRHARAIEAAHGIKEGKQ